MIRSAILGLVLIASAVAELTPAQLERVDYLQNQLLAPCCWSETVADHRSPLSLEMREEIVAMVAAGKTDREVIDRYKTQYGMRILVEPEGGAWWIMNIVPFAMLAIGAIVAVFTLRKWLKPLPEEAAGQA